jgi:hypothetical protein
MKFNKPRIVGGHNPMKMALSLSPTTKYRYSLTKMTMMTITIIRISEALKFLNMTYYLIFFG